VGESKATFKRLDKNKDGIVTKQEFVADATAGLKGDAKKVAAREAEAAFREADINNDGKLDRKEVAAAVENGLVKTSGPTGGDMSQVQLGYQMLVAQLNQQVAQRDAEINLHRSMQLQLGQMGMNKGQQQQTNQNWQGPPQGWQQQSNNRYGPGSPDCYDPGEMADLRSSLKDASGAIMDMQRELLAMREGGPTHWKDEGYYGSPGRGSRESSAAMHFDNKDSRNGLLQSYKNELAGLMHEAATWQAGVGKDAALVGPESLPAESVAYNPNDYK